MAPPSRTTPTHSFETPHTTTTANPPMQSPPPWEYDVFLSFRGPEARHKFTSHLFYAFEHKNLITFLDDICLKKGGIITKEIERAIRGSRFSVVVLSKDYASSTYCLDELLTMAECVKKTGHRIFPVFYHVDPDDVSNKTGVYAEAFLQHERIHRSSKIDKWWSALKRMSATAGYHLKEDRCEAELVRKIADDIERAKYGKDDGSAMSKARENDLESGLLISVPRLDSEILTQWIIQNQKTKQTVPLTNKAPQMSGLGAKIIVLISIGCVEKIQVLLTGSSEGLNDQVPHCKILDNTNLFDYKNVSQLIRTMISIIGRDLISYVDWKLEGDKVIIATSEIGKLLEHDFRLPMNNSTADVKESKDGNNHENSVIPKEEEQQVKEEVDQLGKEEKRNEGGEGIKTRKSEKRLIRKPFWMKDYVVG